MALCCCGQPKSQMQPSTNWQTVVCCSERLSSLLKCLCTGQGSSGAVLWLALEQMSLSSADIYRPHWCTLLNLSLVRNGVRLLSHMATTAFSNTNTNVAKLTTVSLHHLELILVCDVQLQYSNVSSAAAKVYMCPLTVDFILDTVR